MLTAAGCRCAGAGSIHLTHVNTCSRRVPEVSLLLTCALKQVLQLYTPGSEKYLTVRGHERCTRRRSYLSRAPAPARDHVCLLQVGEVSTGSEAAGHTGATATRSHALGHPMVCVCMWSTFLLVLCRRYHCTVSEFPVDLGRELGLRSHVSPQWLCMSAQVCHWGIVFICVSVCVYMKAR